MPYTLVSFHAHPDDEALLTAGTLARAAAEGHRVVLVVATDGGAGTTTADRAGDLGARRLRELAASAVALGCLAVHHLGFADSGDSGDSGDLGDNGAAGAGEPGFAGQPVEVAAQRLAEVLRGEHADVLTVYDPAGGYGHPDHVQVHHVGVRAAELAGTPVVLEATIDRDRLLAALRLLRRLRVVPSGWDPAGFATSYSPAEVITHRVDVRRYSRQKRAAMAAHVSQAGGPAEQGVRTLAAFLRLPDPLFRLAFGREWYVERGRRPGQRPFDDIFASLRRRS